MDTAVSRKFKTYPDNVRPKLIRIRQLILEVAEEEKVGDITETLKWGEPSYLSKTGSAVRFDWKLKHPDQYALYFNCKTQLVETFRELYSDVFHFEGRRAITFNLDEPLPIQELKICLSMSLRYKKIKHLPLLGA